MNFHAFDYFARLKVPGIEREDGDVMSEFNILSRDILGIGAQTTNQCGRKFPDKERYPQALNRTYISTLGI